MNSTSKLISINSIAYAFLLFLTIWNTFQFQKPSIPMSQGLYYLCLLFLFFVKAPWKDLSFNKNLKVLLGIVVIGGLLYLIKGLGSKDYNEAISIFFRIYFVCIVLEKAHPKELQLSKSLFVAMIIIHCLITFYERSTLTVMLWDSTEYSLTRNDISVISEFRASGLFGHPVLSAFLVTIILSFIQFSDYTSKTKILFTIFMLFSLLCINSRANVIVSGLITLYVFKNYIFSGKNQIVRIIVGAIVIYGAYDMMMNTDWGGRLMTTEARDEGILARFEAFGIFSFLNLQDMMLGDLDLADRATALMQASYIENGYLTLILRYGLLFALPLIYLLTKYQLQLTGVYKKYDRWILVGAFVAIANTNPHIGHQIPWAFWFISYYLFRPNEQQISKIYD